VAEAGRVIAGSAGGIRLVAPGPGTRPLADRVKQAVFAVLEPHLSGAAVLDLFAGSGAAGIEALSRGAARAVLVERDERAVRVIAANLGRTGLADRAVVIRRDVSRYLADGPGADGAAAWPFDLVVVDPPYAERALREAVLARLGEVSHGAPAVVAPGGRVIVTHFWKDAPPAVVGLLASVGTRRFGETAVAFYRREDA
jgi:16S rRNA (guanine(966)-N(2))-methyltransferase RsmD